VRVVRSFAFLDLTGFSALTEAQGDQRAVEVLTVFRTALRDICSRRGVRIAKWLGDGAMLVCVETTPLVAGALEMGSAIDAAPEDITIKCGITVGPVILLEGDDYIGHAVNVASRLCDRALPHEVLADCDVVPLIPAWAKVQSNEQIALVGLEHPIEVARLAMIGPNSESTPDPVCRIPLTRTTASETRTDGHGALVMFCSTSCAEMWDQRRSLGEPDAGSIRELWMR
jgi:adenylate cyclase